MLIDPASLALVLCGTLVVTFLQAGFGQTCALLGGLTGLLAKPFDAGKTKAELARQIRDLAQDGLVRARPAPIGDAEFGQATAALIHGRSLDALIARHEEWRNRRAADATAAQGVLMLGAEVAQVMGLVGTLIGLVTMAVPEGGAQVASAIGLAVLTTLYGLVLANFVFLPLAGLIERRAAAEDKAREELFHWLESHAQRATPRLHRAENRTQAA